MTPTDTPDQVWVVSGKNRGRPDHYHTDCNCEVLQRSNSVKQKDPAVYPAIEPCPKCAQQGKTTDDDANPGATEADCETCGKTFEYYPRTDKNRRFCSRECYREGITGTKVCRVCNQRFDPEESLWEKVCSFTCASHPTRCGTPPDTVPETPAEAVGD